MLRTRGNINAVSRKEVKQMSNKGKYVLAALAGAAVGGSVVALSTRALPNLMSGMMAKCEQMMAGMKAGKGGDACDCDASDVCKQMMAEKGQTPRKAACQSEGGSCHGSD